MAVTMSSQISFFFISCILIDIILINIVRCESFSLYENMTDHVLRGKPVHRSKRSPPEILPNELTMAIRYPTGETDELLLTKDGFYLANHFLPVLTSSGHEDKNVMKDVGEFIFFQEATRSVAIVYFKKFNSFFGVIGLKYAITNLPNRFDAVGHHPGIIGDPYITTRTGTLGHEDVQLCETDVIQQPDHSSDHGTIDSIAGPSRKRPRVKRDVNGVNYDNVTYSGVSRITKRHTRGLGKQYYLEILVFVTKDVVEFFKELYGTEIHREWLVRFYILHFNAVDMVFQKVGFPTLRLKINIAKVIIEDAMVPFNFINDGELHFTEIVPKLREYLKINRHIHTPDSFDYVFISTRRQIMDKLVSVQGVTDIGGDMYAARLGGNSYDAIPITAVGFDHDYVVTVREISRVLRIQTTPNLAGKCSGIMGESDSKCGKCLQWSTDNRHQFQIFLRMNRNRCFLLNKPRSTRLPGPDRLVSPVKQCQCYGYLFYKELVKGHSVTVVGSRDCEIPLVCGNRIGDQSTYNEVLEPFDGTGCGTHKVCWNGECTHANSIKYC